MKNCLEVYIRLFVSDKKTQRVKWLALGKRWYNHSIHTAEKMMLFITLFLREISKVELVEYHIKYKKHVLLLLKVNLTLAHKHNSEISFYVGDWVFLHIKPYKQISLEQHKKDNKFMTQVFWSLQGVAKDWYCSIQIGATCIFPSIGNFQNSCLKKGITDKIHVPIILPELDEKGKIVLELKDVTKIRT